MLTDRVVDRTPQYIMSSTNIIEGWPNSAIVGLATLLFTAIAAPLGWILHRYWVREGQSISCLTEFGIDI